MELTAQTFVEMDGRISAKQKIALAIAASDGTIGILPDSEFKYDGVFVRNTFEIEHFRCTALLPGGDIVDADESVAVTIPMLYGDTYYLAVGLGDEVIDFECKGVSLTHPTYTYSICTLDELAGSNRLPVVRFKAKDGVLSVDTDYIVPQTNAVNNKHVEDYIKAYITNMEKITTHPNLVDGDGKQMLLRYLFRVKKLRPTIHTTKLIELFEDIASAIDYFIITPNGESKEMPVPNLMDIREYLEWLSNYMEAAIAVLDKVVLEDNSIDYDMLKEQIKAEIYERLNPELYERLISDLKTNLRTELSETLTSTLKHYFADEMKPEIHDALSEELRGQLRETLYTSLYDALYNALYVPEEEEEEYIPTI